jgi:hypothetical protein
MKRDKQEGPRYRAFLLASALHFYSGRPLQNLSGVDRLIGSRNRCFEIGPKIPEICEIPDAFQIVTFGQQFPRTIFDADLY